MKTQTKHTEKYERTDLKNARVGDIINGPNGKELIYFVEQKTIQGLVRIVDEELREGKKVKTDTLYPIQYYFELEKDGVWTCWADFNNIAARREEIEGKSTYIGPSYEWGNSLMQRAGL